MNKKFRFLAALLGSAICLLPMTGCFSVAAEVDTFYDDPDDSQELKTITSGDYTYSVMYGKDNTTEKAACIESYTGTAKDLVIPETLDNLDVVGLGDRAFSGNSSIQTVKIPSKLIGTGLYSFAGCTNLKEFTVADGNEYYEAIDGVLYAEDGTYLVQYPVSRTDTSVTVPDGVYDIGNSAFTEMRSLREVKLPSSVTTIGAWAFASCPSLTEINLPSNITSLDDFCFAYCSSLKLKTVPKGVTSIGAGTFAGCTGITEFTIPASVTTIGQAAFAATGLTEINIPATVTEIGYNAFGYKLNSERDLVIDTSFVIRGTKGSQAETYAKDKENGNTFKFEEAAAQTDVSLGLVEVGKTTTTQTDKQTDSDNDSNKTLKYILFGAGGVILLAGGITIAVVTGKKKKPAEEKTADKSDEGASE